MISFHARRVGRRLDVPRRAGTDPTAAIGALIRRAAAPRFRLRIDDRALGSVALTVVAGALAGVQLAPGGRAPVGLIAGAWCGSLAARRFERHRARAEDARITSELPAVLERIATALRSGRSIPDALRLVAPTCHGGLGRALRDAVRVADLGGDRGEVWARLGAAPSEAMPRLARALERAERLGTPIAEAVEMLALDLRARARAVAETEARTAPVRMLFPLAFCFLPAFLLLTIAPIAIEALRTLGGV